MNNDLTKVWRSTSPILTELEVIFPAKREGQSHIEFQSFGDRCTLDPVRDLCGTLIKLAYSAIGPRFNPHQIS